MAVLVLVWIILLVIGFFVAKEFQYIAEQKGYADSSKYFWYTFLLAPYGMLMVIALPDRGVKVAAPLSVSKKEPVVVTKQVLSDELPDL